MQDVLDTDEREYNDKRAVVAFDDKPCQLIRDVLQPINPKPGRLKKEDSE